MEAHSYSKKNVKLWVKGMNPLEVETNCDWKEINLCELMKVNTISNKIQAQFGQLYSFLAHENQLHIFCALMSDHKTIEFDTNISSLAANSKHCLVLLSNGELLKYNCSIETVVPVNFLGIENDDKMKTKKCHITHLACGECVSVACTSSNGVYNIPNHTITLPQHVRIRKVATGFEHCLLLTTNGDVYSWGGGLRGQLGSGEIVAFSDHPQIVEGLAGVKVIDISAQGWHSAAVSSFGDLYTWGWNNQGQLGLMDPEHNERVVSLPHLVSFPGDDEVTVEKVHCGIGHTVIEANGVDGNKNVLLAGWDLGTRFNYTKVSSSSNFEGFRKLPKPVKTPEASLELGTGACQVYFLQRVENE
ncbi:probable E3 ubiquitin-protein ligase HERC3 [Anopheles maculipalpis]|uniref:probable E3 ubiquitin-protein ligase HERC3 n=1 Tax=Anopheles maculipalpis TaxID=1496333 RepID=UPI002158DCEF|nr:probable E3 ubiquitin-protein ligase HERC3 [Anopheles maculipalpis]